MTIIEKKLVRDIRKNIDEAKNGNSRERHHVLAFGRMNPPTTGHEKLITAVKDRAKKVGGGYSVVISHSQDKKKNPLSPAQKLKHARRFFPGTNISTSSPSSPTYLTQAAELHKKGVTHLHMVAGGDRVEQYKRDLNKYNGTHKGALFNFKKIEVHSAGDRDPDAEGVEGMSASKMRAAASSGKFKEFKKGVPAHVSDEHAKELYNDVRKGMNIHEDVFVEDMTPGQIYVPPNSHMPLSRGVMPQIKSADVQAFRAFMARNGIRSSFESVPVDSLSATQAEFSKQKIKRLIDTNSPSLGLMIMISGDDYVLDGHHRWLANYNINPHGMQKVLRFHAPMKRLILVAKTFSGVTYKGLDENVELTEGVYDPGIFKAVFLAGGPGSGKDFILGKIISGFGLVEVSSDPFLTHLMVKHKLDLKMPEHETTQRDLVRGRAKNLEQEKKRLVIAGRLGIIVNGVADEVNKILYKKRELEELGYDTMMVFVNTTDEISRQRNIARGMAGGRTVPENIRSEKWKGAQQAKNQFEIMFGSENFIEVDNSTDIRKLNPEIRKMIEDRFLLMNKKIRAFVNTPPSRPAARQWIQNEMEKKRKGSHSSRTIDTMFEDSFVRRGAPTVSDRSSYGGVTRHIARTSDTSSLGHQPAAHAPDSTFMHRQEKHRKILKPAFNKLRAEDWTAPDASVELNWTAPSFSSRKKDIEWTAKTEAKADAFPRDFDTTMALTTPSGTPAAKGYLSPRLGESNTNSALAKAFADIDKYNKEKKPKSAKGTFPGGSVSRKRSYAYKGTTPFNAPKGKKHFREMVEDMDHYAKDLTEVTLLENTDDLM